MAKKKDSKSNGKSKAPLELAASKCEVQDAEKSSMNQIVEEIEVESPKATEAIVEELPKQQQKQLLPCDFKTTEGGL